RSGLGRDALVWSGLIGHGFGSGRPWIGFRLGGRLGWFAGGSCGPIRGRLVRPGLSRRRRSGIRYPEAIAPERAGGVNVVNAGKFGRVQVTQRGAAIDKGLGCPGAIDAVEQDGLESQLSNELVACQ